MIILDEVVLERSKGDKFNGLTLRHPQAAHIRSISPLPDYDTSEAQHLKVTKPSSKFKLDTKTWRAALYALGVYIVLTLTVAVPIIVLKYKHNYSQTNYSPGKPPWAIDNTNPLPPPVQMAIVGTPAQEKSTCNNWLDSNSPNSIISSFQLPPTGLITIRSNATGNSINPDQLNGTLSVSMNTYSNESSVLFTVEMQSSNRNIRDQTSVCFCLEGNNRGLSIYIPSNIGDDTLVINISVVLPQVNSNIDSFVTYLPMFSQTYGDLRQHLSFNQFTLEGSSRLIQCMFLQASQILVTNMLAPIWGSFNVTNSLTLDSIKGPIIANVTLSPSPVQAQPTLLFLGTGESAINASVILNAPPTTPIPPLSPVFVAQINNFNGPLQLDVGYDEASPTFPLQLQVQNNVAQSTIYMDDKFQGCFGVQTKLAKVFVQSTVDSQTLYYDTEAPYKATGWVGCDPRPASNQVACQSFVNVISALGPVNLTFGF